MRSFSEHSTRLVASCSSTSPGVFVAVVRPKHFLVIVQLAPSCAFSRHLSEPTSPVKSMYAGYHIKRVSVALEVWSEEWVG